MPPPKKRVRFSKAPPAVRIVPRGGREQEPTSVARLRRAASLALHVRELGLPVHRNQRLDAAWGDGTSAGAVGQYTDVQAARNTWHRKRFGGQPWYQLAWDVDTADGRARYAFQSRYSPAAHAARLDDMMLEYQRGRTKHSPY